MLTISTYDAKAGLSNLIQQAIDGEEIIITRHGEPVARLIKYEKPAWKPNWAPLPEDMRVTFAEGEDTAPVFPDGIPWSETDPV